ncbi:hypothetical protein [Pseudorhodobacter sp.]|uniref:hypothetical protein n=1 Tax=Pseudorhodobacter sp. TaxID=1934400 RepID=UPI0026486000|nr:hypothetical protein [Pseudorhodobacter sp.]MDN5785713.1 hypothetical protein [Pseudorhodobacter sp.]
MAHEFQEFRRAAACPPAREPARRCAACSLRTAWVLAEDVIGAVALFALLFAGFWMLAGAGLPTGADALLEVVR